jgi:hypothetical protein
MEQIKRDRTPPIPVNRVRTGRHRTGAVSPRYQEGESSFVRGLIFRCVIAALLFIVLFLGWWLDTSSGHRTRVWLVTTVTQELSESKSWQQVQEWNKQIGKGVEGVIDWFRSIFAPDSEGDNFL